MVNAKLWQNLTMLLICASFIAANLGYGKALDLWTDGAAAILTFMGAGIGLKMGKDVIMHNTTAKYGSKVIDTPKGD